MRRRRRSTKRRRVRRGRTRVVVLRSERELSNRLLVGRELGEGVVVPRARATHWGHPRRGGRRWDSSEQAEVETTTE